MGSDSHTIMNRAAFTAGLLLTLLGSAMSPAIAQPPVPSARQTQTLDAYNRALPGAKSIHSERRRSGGAQMGIIADRVDYDYANHQFAVVGNVQIYYNGATIEADRVMYDQVTKRLRAEGGRLTEANGKVTIGQVIDLSSYYRDGFIDSLGLERVARRRPARHPPRRPLLRQP